MSKAKPKTKKKGGKEHAPSYIGFEPMGEMETIPARRLKQDFPKKKS